MPRTKNDPPATLITAIPFKRAMRDNQFPYTTARDAHFRGELAVIKVGRAWYIEPAEWARFIDSHRVRIAG